MTGSADPVSDEELALRLLIDHLTAHAMRGCQCEINTDDPPDLIVTWPDGQRWGVEVTRAYQQVRQIGRMDRVSSATVSEKLREFAEELKKEQRQRSYSLYFDVPGPFSLWKEYIQWNKWKKEVGEQIRKHIASDGGSILRFRGGKLLPGEPGERWTPMVGFPAVKCDSALQEMLWKSLSGKSRDLERWKEKFTQRWLLLLNCNPLVEKFTEVEDALHRLVREDAGLAGFDGIFWSGYPDRTISRILLSENP